MIRPKRTVYPEPIRPGICCAHCYGELEAVSELVEHEVRIASTVTVQWRHVGGKRTCTVTNNATPGGWPQKPWFDLLEIALSGAAGKAASNEALKIALGESP